MPNKNSLIIPIILIGLLSFTACEKKGNDTGSKLSLLDSLDYFPLHVGNYWEIGSYPYTIDSVKIINDTSYYRKMIRLSGLNYEWGKYRKTADGKVYTRGDMYAGQNEEILNFDLSASEGHTWTFISARYGSLRTWHATLISKHATITVGNYTFKNCYQYYFDAPVMADEEHIIWLAPGIGLIKHASGTPSFYYGEQTITRVKINGVEIDFR